MEGLDITACLKCLHCKDRHDYDTRYDHALFCTANSTNRDPLFGRRLNTIQSCPKSWRRIRSGSSVRSVNLTILEINQPGITSYTTNRAVEYLHGLGINENNASNFGKLVSYVFNLIIKKEPLNDWLFYEMMTVTKDEGYIITDNNTKTAGELSERIRANRGVTEVLGGIDVSEDFDDSGRIYISLMQRSISVIKYISRDNMYVLELADSNTSSYTVNQMLTELSSHPLV